MSYIFYLKLFCSLLINRLRTLLNSIRYVFIKYLDCVIKTSYKLLIKLAIETAR